MKGLYRYIQHSFLTYLFMIILVLLTNIVVFFSDEALDSVDLLYLNALLFIFICMFGCLDFRKFKRTIYNFYQHFIETGQVDKGLIKETGIGRLLLDMLSGLGDQYHEQLNRYDHDLTEIDDYLNKWVHEVKIPISVLSVIAERLPYKEKQDVFYELERIQHYIQQALYISKANHYQHDLHLEMVPLKSLIQDIIKRHKMVLIQKNIQVTVDISEEAIVLTDKHWLSYILGQIIHNAAKYTKDKIVVSLQRLGEDFEILIEDNGVGIEVSEVAQIFKKGYVGKNGRNQAKSTGMGLYLSKKACKILEAKLTVSSTPSEFTRFKLVIRQPDENQRLAKHMIHDRKSEIRA